MGCCGSRDYGSISTGSPAGAQRTQQQVTGQQRWDAILGHAVLDLFDLQKLVPALFDLLPDRGLFYFTINFDGGTIFEPVIDQVLDDPHMVPGV